MSDDERFAAALAFMDGLARQDRDALSALIHPDYIWTLVPERPVAPKTFEDKAALLGQRVFAEDRDGPRNLHFTPLRSAVDSTTVILEVHAVGKRANGTAYENVYLFLWAFQDGLIAEFREHLDNRSAADVLQLLNRSEH